jgi:hypothetical protein
MNPVELYKKLPRTNCGDCRQKACMPFAFALLKGEANLSECSGLPAKEKDELTTSIRKTDWREDLITALKEDIKKIRLDEVAQQIGAEYSGGKLHFRCFGRDVIIQSDGEIQSSRALTPWMRMLTLFYIKNGGGEISGKLAGKWVLHNELRGGLMKYKAFRRECEEPLRELFDSHLTKAALLLDGYGAGHPEEFASQHAWLVYVFPLLPVLLLYWPKDDEFESKVTIRFDSTADSCFDAEQLIFLVEELIKDMEVSLQQHGAL